MTGRGPVLKLLVVGGGELEIAPALAGESCRWCPSPAGIVVELEETNPAARGVTVHLCGSCASDLLIG